MTTQKKDWNLVDEDESDEQVEEIKQQYEKVEDTQQPQKQQQKGIKQQYKPVDRRQERQKFKQQQLRLLDTIEKDNIWIFIFKNHNSELEDAVNEIDNIKKYQGQKGWDLLVSKQQARNLLTYGFKPKRVFAKMVVGKKNFPRQDREDNRQDRDRNRNRNQRRKYIQKQQGVKNQYTFQKQRKNNRRQYDQKDRQQNREKQRQQEKKSREANKYKNDPLYQGLGDFRNKQTSTQQTSEQQKPYEVQKVTFEKQKPRQKVEYKRPYIKNNYKQKQVQEGKKISSDSEPELTAERKQDKPKKKQNKYKKTSNNPFDAFD